MRKFNAATHQYARYVQPNCRKFAGYTNLLRRQTAYFYFSPASTVPKEEMQKYAAAWKQFRAEQQATFEKYDPLNPEGAAGIKQTLLDNGIPGDPLVNWIWSLNNE